MSLPTTPARHTAAERVKIILVRHGKPAIDTAPRTCHRGFRDYIDDYEEAGPGPRKRAARRAASIWCKGLNAVFTSGSPRAADERHARCCPRPN